MKMTIEPKKIRRLKDESMQKRLNKMADIRAEYIAMYEEDPYGLRKQVVLQKGNRKTKDGKTYHTRTVSFIPILDCPNCSGCYKDCYDLRNDCWQTTVMNDRARNSALHLVNPSMFWDRVKELVLEDITKIPSDEYILLRINVGGDLTREDFYFIDDMVKEVKQLVVQFFTKNYNGINSFMDDRGDFDPRVCKLISRWEGMECDNRHNIPESHVLFPEGKTTADFTRPHRFCGGNCSECIETSNGCFGLANGEQVILSSH